MIGVNAGRRRYRLEGERSRLCDVQLFPSWVSSRGSSFISLEEGSIAARPKLQFICWSSTFTNRGYEGESGYAEKWMSSCGIFLPIA